MRVLLLIALCLPSLALAAVVDMHHEPVRQVLDVYEQQREEEEPHQGWIHSFEEESLGNEMDHLSKVKSIVQQQEEIQ